MTFITRGYSVLFFSLWLLDCYADDEVRLVGGNDTSGRVKVFLDGTWQNTATQYWNELEGGVVCRQLGFRGVHSVTHHVADDDDKEATITFSCNGYELSLLECAQLHLGNYQDSFYSYQQDFPNWIAQVTCKTSTVTSAINVTLTDGDNGRVLVNVDGSYQRTCDGQWTKLEGGVICRQLGYRGVNSITYSPTQDYLLNRTHLLRFSCHGYEDSLNDCVRLNLTLTSTKNTGACNRTVYIACLNDLSMSGDGLSTFELISPIKKTVYKMKVGESLLLECNVTGATEIWWKQKTWSRIRPVTYNNILRLDNMSVSDHGSYICFARGSRGQVIESKPQILNISDHAQIVLTVESKESVSSFAVSELFRKSEFNPVSIGNVNKTHFSYLLAKKLTTGVHQDTMSESEVDRVVAGVNKSFTNFSSINNIAYWVQGISFCIGGSEETSAGVLWFPSTAVNSIASSNETCFSSDIPRATRECVGDFVTVAAWKDSVLRNCFADAKNSTENKEELVQEFLTNIEEEDLSLSSVSAISHDLADVTSPDVIKAENIDQVADILSKISNVNSSSPTVTRNVLEVLDNVLTISTEDEGSKLVPETSSTLLTSLEKQLESVQKSGSNFSDNRPNIAVEVVQIQDLTLPITFASLDTKNNQTSGTSLGQDIDKIDQRKIETSIELPNYIVQRYKECLVYENGTQVFPVTFAIHRSQALFYDPKAASQNLKQNSWVVSTSTICEVSELPLEHSVSTHFSPLETSNQILKRSIEASGLSDKPQTKNGKCVFWDRNLGGKDIGGWSSKGCSNFKKEGAELYECVCNHLPRFANFAVLIDIKGNTNNFALYVLTVIGCLASIISLIITIVSYLAVKKIRSSQPQRITLNLCFALLCLYLCFLIGIHQTGSRAICIIFGGLIHLFCLSSVAWMSVEATQLYLLLVKVVDAHVKNFLMKATIIAWGFPFIIVVICIAARSNDYSHEYCFPKSSSFVFYIGVLGLLAVMLAYNISTYIAIIWNLCAARKNISSSQSNKTMILRRFQNAFAILILLGLSWCFGFLAIGSLRMTFNVLFCLFNSFQGVFIFLIFCLRQEEVRAAWKSWFGIKPRPKGKEEDASMSQSKLLSTTKDVTMESEVTSKPFDKAPAKLHQIELKEVSESQVTTTATIQNEASGKQSEETKQSEQLKAEDSPSITETTMTSTFTKELKEPFEASGKTSDEAAKTGEGPDDNQAASKITVPAEFKDP